MEHINPHVTVNDKSRGESHKPADRIQMPLQFLKLNHPLTEHISKNDVTNYDNQKGNPYPIEHPANRQHKLVYFFTYGNFREFVIPREFIISPRRFS